LKIGKTKENIIPFTCCQKDKSRNTSRDVSFDCIHTNLDNIRLCVKNKLPKEKNYCITEKNLKKIELAIEDKDSDIESLKAMLLLAKKDIDHFQEKYNKLYCIIDELNDEKANIKDEINDLLNENKMLKQNLDEYISQYDKILLVQKKFENTINKLIETMNTFDNFNKDCLNLISSTNREDKSDFLKNMLNLHKIIAKDQIKNYISIFSLNENQLKEIDKKVYNEISNASNINLVLRQKSPISNTNLTTSSSQNSIFNLNKDNRSKSYLEQLEEKCKALSASNLELKQKNLDLENFIQKLNPILENSKDINLSETAKDLISMNKKVMNLNKSISKLEMENCYFKIYIHNLCEMLPIGYRAEIIEKIGKMNLSNKFINQDNHINSKDRYEYEIKVLSGTLNNKNEEMKTIERNNKRLMESMNDELT